MKAAIIRRRHLTDADYQPGGSGGGGGIQPPIIQPPSTPGLTFNGLDFIITNQDYPNGLIVPDFTNAGMYIHGGIPDTSSANTITVSGFTKDAIDTAITAAQEYVSANPGQFCRVLFPAGNYTYAGNLIVSSSRIVLKGAGRTQTRIKFSGGTSVSAVGGHIWFRGSLGSARTNLAASSARGSKTIQLEVTNNISNGKFAAGKYVRLEQGHYPVKFDKKYKLWKPLGSPGSPPIFVRDLIRIESANAGTNTLTTDLKLLMDIDHTRATYVQEVSSVLEWVGVEDMTIESTMGDTAAHDGVAFSYVDKGWMLDVDVVNPPYFPVNYFFSRHIEVAGRVLGNSTFSNPQLVGGNFQGYAGFIATCHSLWKNIVVDNGRHLIIQGQASGNVFHNVRAQGVDFHFPHTGSGHACLADLVVCNKASNTPGKSSAKPYLVEMGPENDNDIHTIGGFSYVIWNSDFDGWKYGRGVRKGIGEGLVAYTRMLIPNYHSASRNGLVGVYDNVSGFIMYNNHLAARTEQANDSEALYRARSTPAEILPGTVDERVENGVTVYARQTGVGPSGYPPLTAEPGSRPFVEPKPSVSTVEFRKNKFYGITNPANKEIKRFGGAVVDIGNEYIDSSAVVPRPTAPDALVSLYLAQLAFRQNNPSSFN